MFTASFAIVVRKRRRPQNGRVLKTRKRSLLVRFQKRKMSRDALRKEEILIAVAEVAEVLLNKRRPVSFEDHQQFPVIRVMLKNAFKIFYLLTLFSNFCL